MDKLQKIALTALAVFLVAFIVAMVFHSQLWITIFGFAMLMCVVYVLIDLTWREK